MKPSKTAAPGRLLTQAAGERQTGALVVGGHPGGTVYLIEGQVSYAESAAAPGVGELLTASGRLAARTWQAALDAGTSRAQVGRLLLDQGHLTQGELELCVLGATYDAAYFALSPASAPVDFLDGAAHWLGPIVRVDPAAVTREARRRARLLDEIYPHPQLDTAPVIPVPRPPVERVTLTAAQWELLVHADGQRTPADLAQLLGRAGYATIQELRRLAALGLIERPEVRERETAQPDFVRLPRARGTAVDVRRPALSPADGPTVPIIAGPRPAPASGDPPGAAPQSGLAPTPGADRPPRLARRKPGAKLPKDVAADTGQLHTGTDEVLLKRIRTALRALR
ncbi:helix-turn-helix domain-containing protein [Actinoplanes sp. NPDC048967]|uniref:MarR family transcriptional regulator n=1 Tax=Actinoplanes sp. NPDC048967 TaxID=3155269 RepID=UPI0034031D59